MNNRIRVLIESFNECSACMSRNAAKVGTYTPLKQAVTTLDARIAVIQQTVLEHEKNIKGIAEQKKEGRRNMAALTDVMRMKVQSAALSHNDKAAYKNANFTFSDLYRAPALKAIANAGIVYQLANGLSAADKTTF